MDTTVINNIYDASVKPSAITMADIEKAMRTVKGVGGPVGLGTKTPRMVDINPCSEIICGQINAAQIASNSVLPDRIVANGNTVRKENVLSTESGNKVFAQYAYNDSLDVDFDEAVWRIYMPGVPKEDVQVFTVKDRVHVDVSSGAPRKTFQLAEGETVKSTKLELGVLTITIDRPDKRVAVEVE